jgi:hypothetical protein
MKKKMDFVTNSSSTSFIAWGITMDLETLKEKYGKGLFKLYQARQDKKKHEKAMKQGAMFTVPSSVAPEKEEEDYLKFLEDDFTWSIEGVIEDSGLNCRSMPYEDELMIGRCPFSIKPDQTLTEFKQDICNSFKQCGIDMTPDQLGQIEECWMDN